LRDRVAPTATAFIEYVEPGNQAHFAEVLTQFAQTRLENGFSSLLKTLAEVFWSAATVISRRARP
jgi:hypothetical protein